MNGSLLDKSCLPVKNYVSTIEIREKNHEQTLVNWFGHFKAKTENRSETVSMFEFNYNLICSNMEKQYIDYISKK